MKNLCLYILILLLTTHFLLKSEEQKLFVIKTETKTIYDNNKFNLYLYTSVKDKENLPKINAEKLSISYIMPQDEPDKKIKLGNTDKLIWVKVSDQEYKMLIASPTIKGKGKSGATVSFTYSNNGKDDLKFEDSIEFELK